MTRPSPESLRRAARFLDAALSADGTAADVAWIGPIVEWMEAQANAAEEREMCRDAGVPVRELRRRLRA